MLRIALALCALFIVIGQAGPTSPFIVRTVTLDGIVGPSYYSVVEQGYRFVENVGAQATGITQAEAASVDHGTDSTGIVSQHKTTAQADDTDWQG